MNHDAKLGIGLATGMFYHAEAGTALPSSPLASLGASWEKVGDVDVSGITLNFNMNTQSFRNWANKVKRSAVTDYSGDVAVPIMDTTEESLTTVFGKDKVQAIPANSTHGKQVKVDLSMGELPPEEAYLFLMKDGDDAIMIGCTTGQIKNIDEVAMEPTNLIKWRPTIEAHLDSNGKEWVMLMDDGNEESS